MNPLNYSTIRNSRIDCSMAIVGVCLYTNKERYFLAFDLVLSHQRVTNSIEANIPIEEIVFSTEVYVCVHFIIMHTVTVTIVNC